MYSSLAAASLLPVAAETSARVTHSFEKNSLKRDTVSSSKPSAESSPQTPSIPILSSLSRVMQALSSLSSAIPRDVSSPRSSPRSFILTVKSPMPVFFSALEVVSISSISHSGSAEPIISISHCINSRILPFCGFSARYTLSVCIARKGRESSARLFAK